MKDRVPQYPGRVRLTPVVGQDGVFDLTMVDGATEQGTPLNKATFLKDATEALYGLTNAVPDDVFNKLSKELNSAKIRTGSYVGTGEFYSFSGKSKASTGITDSQVVSCAYGNGKIVAVGNRPSTYLGTSNYFYVSSDKGLTWTKVNVPTTAVWRRVRFINNEFFVVGSSDKFYKSTDGLTWTEKTFPSSSLWTDIEYGNGRYVAISHNGIFTYSSDGGNTWSPTANVGISYPNAITFGNGNFVVVGGDQDAGSRIARIAYGNGITFTSSGAFSRTGVFTIVGKTSNYFVARDIDGYVWWKEASDPSGDWSISDLVSGNISVTTDNSFVVFAPVSANTSGITGYIYEFPEGSRYYNMRSCEYYTIYNSSERNPYAACNIGNGEAIAVGNNAAILEFSAGAKNKITLDIEPKLLIVALSPKSLVPQNGSWSNSLIWFEGATQTSTGQNITFEQNSNVIEWYSTSSANYQLNTAGSTYNYIVIGENITT